MGSVSKERLFGATIQATEQRASETRRIADQAACEAWNIRMKVVARRSHRRCSATLNAGYRHLEVKCDGCGTHNTVDLTIIRRPRKRRSGNWSSACAAGRARTSAATLTSAAIWCGCGAARLRPKTTASLGTPATSGIRN
jgi:hypothetical protein